MTHITKTQSSTAHRAMSLLWSLLLLGGTVCAQLPPAPISPVPVQRFEYDANGNLTRNVQQLTVQGAGYATQHNYDSLNRRVNTLDARSGLVQFEYAASGELTALTDPINAQTRYDRDGLGQVLTLRSPDSGTANHSYDAAGGLVLRSDARGVVTSYTYDALGRLTNLNHSGAGLPSQSFGFNYDETFAGNNNSIGQLTSMIGPASVTSFGHDPLGRLVRQTQRSFPDWASGGGRTLEHVTSVVRDAAGQPISLTLPSGRVLSYTRANGVLLAISVAANAGATGTALISQIQWLPFGGAGAWFWHTNTGVRSHDRSFDTAGRAVRYSLGNQVRDLTYDAADRIAGFTHYNAFTGAPVPSLNQQFGYDELNRLTSVAQFGRMAAIAYDANGNRTAMNINGAVGTYSTQPQSNRMTSAPFPSRSIAFDGAGNSSVVAGGWPGSYDAAGRTSAVKTKMADIRYAYDALGQRVVKQYQLKLRPLANTLIYGDPADPGLPGTPGGTATPSAITVYIYDSEQQLLGEYDGNTGQAQREYVWLNDTPVAMLVSDPANPQGLPLIYFIHTDHLNTPRVVMDRNNAVRWRWLDEPFGASPAEEDPSALGVLTFNLRFPGQVFDAETGLHYNLHRYYEPGVGRYTQSDPIGLQGGINTYAYVGGNPVSYTDPYGLDMTIWLPGPGRSVGDGPRNGNWGGRNWSGGRAGSGKSPYGIPPTDSADACYRSHDICFDSGANKSACSKSLVQELRSLPADPRKWPFPPKPGTEADTIQFLNGALLFFAP